MDELLDVARSININDVPPTFEFTYSVDEPISVLSPTEAFSDPLICPFADLFNGSYNAETKTWKDGDPGNLPLDIKAEVLLQQLAYDAYIESLVSWEALYQNNRWAEYRKHLAQILIDVCTP
jgi:hypothetical protein